MDVPVSEPIPHSKTKSETKHVEGVAALCPDAGSNPASSTKITRNYLFFRFLRVFFNLKYAFLRARISFLPFPSDTVFRTSLNHCYYLAGSLTGKNASILLHS